jgi:hypothetical protein
MLKCPSAHVDFFSEKSLKELSHELSAAIFGGIPFVGKAEGIWDEIPAVRLSQRVLGLDIILGGSTGEQGGYSLEAEAHEFPWDEIPPSQAAEFEVDLSPYFWHLISTLPGIRQRP